ncbi:MAG TPA: hypothetical protein VJB14_11585 [Planctomycetota bacterium]|nr:hypothetical protein [Planctomycetota bacterium]
MSDRDGDLLIHRHLEGDLGEEEARALSERVAADPVFGRRLAEMAYDQAQLRDVLETEKAVETGACPIAAAAPPAREPSRWSRGSLAAAASILVAVGVALFIGFRPKEQPPVQSPQALPAAPKVAVPKKKERKETPPAGFRGKVSATVSRKTDAHVILTVSAPEELAGKTINLLNERKPLTERLKVHASYLRKLDIGQEVVVDVRPADGGDFALGELTEEQAAWAMKEDKKRPERKPDPKKPPVREGEGDRKEDK